MRQVSGTYTGNGVDSRQITGLGLTPKLLFITTNGSQFRWRSSDMTGDYSLRLGGAVTGVTDSIQALLSDGFEVGTATDVNANGSTYYYLAFEADSAILETGTYTGNGLDSRNITITTTPVILFVGQGLNTGFNMLGAAYRTSTVAGDNSFIADSTDGLGANYIQSMGAGTFQVGTAARVNQNTIAYYWFSFAANADQIAVGSYTGNNTDNRDIVASPAIQPIWAWTKRHSTGNPNSACTRWGTAMTSGAILATGFVGDTIQAFNTNGFQVGTHYAVNGNDGFAVNDYYWFAIAGPPAISLPALPTVPSSAGVVRIGGDVMPFAPYQKYKAIRQLGTVYNNLVLGP